VNGRIEVDEWEDKQTGAKRSKVVAIASDVSLGVKRVKADTQQSSSNPSADW
jgi:single-stranded DNA-binding protein